MKKLYLFLTLVLWGFAQVAEAQNVYRNYQSTAIPRPESAVSVVHSHGYVYFFQADDNGNLSVTEIDPLSMLPTGNNRHYDLSQQNIACYLNGGFEDASGRFVLFGHIWLNNTRYPACLVILSNLSSCDIYYDPSPNGSFTAGCDGYDQAFGEVYMLVNHRRLTAFEAAFPTNLHSFELDPNTNPNDYFTDISWDAFHNYFIATGTAFNFQTWKHHPFVTVFELSNYNAITHAEYVLDYSTNANSSDLKSLHTQLDMNSLIVYHDRRRDDLPSPYSYDIIWLSRIDNFWNLPTANVAESWLYELPSTKIFSRDMVYDPYKNRLDFLGFYNKCREGEVPLLAQVDPYNLASGIEIGQLGAGFLGGTCLNDYPPYEKIAHNDLKMFNLALNIHSPCSPLLIAGVDGKRSVLTETYDISASFCDIPMWHTDSQVGLALKPYPLGYLPYSPSSTSASATTLSDNVSVTILCDEDAACSHQFGGKVLNQPRLGGDPTAEITIEPDRLFVCEGFEGDIQYTLYDVAGKVLQQGVTRNGEYNSLKMYRGVYLLKATDAVGCHVVKKIVLL